MLFKKISHLFFFLFQNRYFFNFVFSFVFFLPRIELQIILMLIELLSNRTLRFNLILSNLIWFCPIGKSLEVLTPWFYRQKLNKSLPVLSVLEKFPFLACGVHFKLSAHSYSVSVFQHIFLLVRFLSLIVFLICLLRIDTRWLFKEKFKGLHYQIFADTTPEWKRNHAFDLPYYYRLPKHTHV